MLEMGPYYERTSCLISAHKATFRAAMFLRPSLVQRFQCGVIGTPQDPGCSTACPIKHIWNGKNCFKAT